MARTPGWVTDPYGRYEQRYWDGTGWTEHVATSGVAAVDPLGASPIVPIAIPQSAYVAPIATATAATTTQARSNSPLLRFVDGLSPEARTRPQPRLAEALAAAGGVIAAVGITVGIVGDVGSRGKAMVAAVVVLGLALAGRLLLTRQPEARSAAVGAGVVGIASLTYVIVGDQPDSTLTFAVAAALFAFAWVLPGFQGRPIMLGLSAAALVGFMVSATATDNVGNSDRVLFDPFGTLGGVKGSVFLLAAAALVIGIRQLDGRGYHGIATSLVAVALGSAFIGAAISAIDLGDTGAAALAIVVGLGVCAVGSFSRRRATTWWGTLVTSIGTIAFFSSVMRPDSTTSTSATVFVSGALLVVGPIAVRAVRSRAATGATPATGASPATGALPPPQPK